ncbi:MAG: hypothetical protein IK077_05830, partial [Thermoguttaceae bacterium]|nr:hypothetical protein [Thermoguttaceae bacterium]
MLKLNFYCHLFVLVIICVFATIYVSTVQSAEPIEGSSSNNPQTTEGFLGLRTIVIPEEGLEAGEKEFLNAVKKVVDVLSKGKNVRQILNECDQYVAPFFGTKSGVVNQSSIGFSSLSVLEFDGLSEEKNPEEFYKKRTDTITLSSDLGYIVVSRYRNS